MATFKYFFMWTYNNPVEIIFGQNKFEEIHKFIKNKKYVILTYLSNRFNNYINYLNNSQDPPIKIFPEVKSNPDFNDILLLLEKFSNFADDIDCILAIGGGSVIDTAKALSAFKGNKDSFTDFVRNNKQVQVLNPINIFAIPTTSGSSSEFTCWATIWDKEKKAKLSLDHINLYPKKAIIDPLIMLCKPKNLTISTGLDVLSHSLESLWNINANPVSAIHAITSAKLIIENLPKLADDLENIQLRRKVALACVHAGLAFSNTKTAIAHNISYPITLNRGIQHGIACSFSLPIVMHSMKGINQDAEKRLSMIFNDSLENSAWKLNEILRKLEIPLNLNELKINKHEWNTIVKEAFMGERGKNFLGTEEAFIKASVAMNIF